MKLNRKQFDLLELLIGLDFIPTQRELQKLSGYSLGTVSHTLKSLKEAELLDQSGITKQGMNVMEQYRVKRAVFIAAGFGSRMVPITLNTPKPLVRVRGKRIIDSLLDAVLQAGIEDIVIVRGYLAEQFDQLLYKYPMIRFIDNPLYNETNNISSAMCARNLLKNAYVFEADLLLSNPAIVKKYQYTTNFLGIRMDRTDDWCFTVKDGFITSQRIGGVNCYQEVGISYWNEEAGERLEEDIAKVFDEMPGGKERYWDQVIFSDFPERYKVEIRECQKEDIVEIDTFNELKALDKAYDI